MSAYGSSLTMGAGGGGDNFMMGAGADDGDLMAYNAYPSGHSSMSAAFGGLDGPSPMMQQQQQQHQQQPQQQPQQNQHVLQQQVQQQQQQDQLRAQMQQQAHQQQAQMQAQAYALAPARTSTAPAQPTMVSLTPKGPIAASSPSPASPEYAGHDDPGYLELLWQRRRDVAKLCILSLVVLFAISMHSAAWHYLREYIETAAKLTYWQEAGLRVAYPVVVCFLLWNLKATM